jgi:hypothetical protein
MHSVSKIFHRTESISSERWIFDGDKCLSTVIMWVWVVWGIGIDGVVGFVGVVGCVGGVPEVAGSIHNNSTLLFLFLIFIFSSCPRSSYLISHLLFLISYFIFRCSLFHITYFIFLIPYSLFLLLYSLFHIFRKYSAHQQYAFSQQDVS